MVPETLATPPVQFATSKMVASQYRSSVNRLFGRDSQEEEIPVSAYQPRPFTGECNRCKQKGHMRRDCPMPYCGTCRTAGHAREACEFVVVSRSEALAKQIPLVPINTVGLSETPRFIKEVSDVSDESEESEYESGNAPGDRL
jgi:hypothetical protein